MLTIALTLAGGLEAKADQDGKGLTLAGGNGAPSLRYTGLTARDADGKDLRAWLEVRGDRLLLRADDAGARYPVVVDPFIWAQLAELTASDQTSEYDLGWSVAVSGNTVVAGTPFATVGSHLSQGAVYVFVEPVSGWANITQTAKLTASDGGKLSYLGQSVAISGNTVVAGAPGASVAYKGQGAAYVFVKPASGWADMTQTAKLIASDGQTGDSFGTSVAISNGTTVVGAPFAQVDGNLQAGAAYVFLQPSGGANKTENAKLTAAGAPADQFLGMAVAISGSTIVAGAEDNQVVGAVYVFVKPSGGWASTSSTAELTSADNAVGTELGFSVAIDGSTVVAGAPFAPIGNNGFQGAAYVWVEPANGWANMTETAMLYAAKGIEILFGTSVAVEGNTVVAVAPFANGGAGAAYIFIEPATGWVTTSTFRAELEASDETDTTHLGNSVALSGNTLVVGAPGYGEPGATYVFGKSPSQ